jgi:uncharacterized coiled-coil DUF342 family protein
MNESTELRIKKNRRRIFDADSFVRFNTAQTLVGRSAIEENRTLALESFAAESSGNGTLLSATFDDVIRNRLAILEQLEPSSPEEERFKNAMTNRARIEGIERRAQANRNALKINEMLGQVNKLMVEINVLITEHNNEFFDVIDDLSNSNAAWIDGELERNMKAANPAANDQMITENTSRVTEVRERAEGNRVKIMELYDAESGSRAALEKDLEDVMELRSQIVALREKIVANQHRVADGIAVL